ncbi:MAG TPA: M23 family metallopeptidase [Balneolaceae bacterium]|nr:M23 family metallopeptidase [Balneolaceae bacterium]
MVKALYDYNMKNRSNLFAGLLWGITIILFLCSCKTAKLPAETYDQYAYRKSFRHVDDHLIIEIENPLHAPLRVWMFNNSNTLQNLFDAENPVEIGARSDTTLIYEDITEFDQDIRFSSRLGSLQKEIQPVTLEFPFPKNKEYRVLQGNNTDFTHNTEWSRYAIDFDLKTNDTVTSASDGYVVGVVDKYDFGGVGAEWQPFANYITVYEPESGIFIQYVHLVKNGSFVQVGDKIRAGQPIARSGNTGQSTIEHLHFNVLVPENSENGLRSVPIEFEGGIEGTRLKEVDVVRR